ncbi:MAG: alanine racemase [Parcubacteria group bacterium]
MATHTTWVEISRQALKHNVRLFQAILRRSGSTLMAVVKSNAYGHGISETARITQALGVRWFGVADTKEALLLRKEGISSRILVLSFIQRDLVAYALKENVSLPVHDYSMALIISRIAARTRHKANIHIKIDTGAHRLGIAATDALHIVPRILKLPSINLEGFFTHFADSENPDQHFTNEQISIFNSTIQEMRRNGIISNMRHAACSASTLLNRSSHMNLARVGLSLYGLSPLEKERLSISRMLRPVLSWKTRIIQIKTVVKGGTIGYGRTFYVKRQMRIATIAVGYWDGYDRKLSNTGRVLIHGAYAPLIGRVCMNVSMVDVTNITSCKAGDEVVLLGYPRSSKYASRGVTADELAKKLGTINYEVVTRINPLIPRIIV